MEDVTNAIALSLGAGWASGINLYAAVLMLGYMGMTGRLELPEPLQILSDPLVMLAAGLMYFIEFFADKVIQKAEREKATEIARKDGYIELAKVPNYSRKFAEATYL